MRRVHRGAALVMAILLIASAGVYVTGAQQAPTDEQSVEQAGPGEYTNGNVTVTISATGGFSMRAGETNLLYPGTTSYLTVRVDGTTYAMYGNESLSTYAAQQPTIVGDTVVTEWELPDGVTVRQNVTLDGDTAHFAVDVVNDGGSARDVDVRYLFDYQVEEQDGAPIRTGGEVYINETAFDAPSFTSWEALPVTEATNASEVTTIGTQTVQTQPDRVVFANWASAYSSAYEYGDFDPTRRFYTPGSTTSPESDSAGLLYWDLGSVAAGESQTVMTSYGASEAQQGASQAVLDVTPQDPTSQTVSVNSAYLSEGGFLTVRDASGSVLGVSSYLQAEVPASNVAIALDAAVGDVEDPTVVPHHDTDGDRQFDFENDSSVDTPYTEGGEPVSVAVPVEQAGRETFAVSNLSAPANVTQGETVTVSADVANTGEAAGEQEVEFRLAGTTLLTETVSLGAGETTTTTFQVPTGDVAPGTYTHGVFSANDSQTAQLTVEAPEEPGTGNATVQFTEQESNGSSVTVDSVTLENGGYVVIHAPDGAVLGHSDYLGAGTHENVSVALDTELSANVVLTAMAHVDDGDQTYEFGSGTGADGPYTNDAGQPVTDDGCIVVV